LFRENCAVRWGEFRLRRHRRDLILCDYKINSLKEMIKK
jgi:hypothetical protein